MIGALGFGLLLGMGGWLGWPRPMLRVLLALWWAVLMLVSVPTLGVHQLHRVVGGDLRAWTLVGLIGGLVMLYRSLLPRLRQRAAAVAAPLPPATPEPQGPFSGAELQRYARHIMLREIGGTGQQRLKGARVLVVGAGGLGAPALLYLAASGVGTIGVIDPDEVALSNLQRQIIHATDRVGLPKVFSAETALKALNPEVELRPYHRRLDADVAALLVADYDLVLDGTDDFATRLVVNRACVAEGKPLISGAIGQWEGQLSLYDPARGGPCFECIFPQAPPVGLAPSCAEAGVAAPLPGVIGAMMAGEAVKHLTGAGQTLRGRLLLQDMLHMDSRTITIRPRMDCPVCGDLHRS